MEKSDEKQRARTLRSAMENAEPTACWVEGCPDKATQVHSIQAAVLSLIANPSGKVLTVMPRSFAAATNPNREMFTELHINKASVGAWSCNPHDQGPEIENREPDWQDPRATFLLAYRAVLYGNWVAQYERNIWEARAMAFPSEVEARGNASFSGAARLPTRPWRT